jgi:hypothetical protein
VSRRPGLYALLLKAYPREYSAAHGGELLATLEESSGGRVVAREAAGLLLGAVRQRRLSDRVRDRRTALICAAWLGALLLLGLDLAVGTAIAVGDLRDGALQDTPRALGGLLSGAVLALCLRGRVRGALAVLLLELVLVSGLAVATYEPSLVSVSLVVPVIVLGVMSARQPSAVSTRSWWWLAVPPLWGAGLMASSSSAIWLQVSTLALVTVLAGCEARFALAAAGVFLVMAADVVLAAVVLSSSVHPRVLALGAAMVGIALFLALLGGPALTRSLSPASPRM